MATALALKKTAKELRQKRVDLVGTLRSFTDRVEKACDAETRDWSAEEREQFDKMSSDLDDHDKKIADHDARIDRIEKSQDEGGESEGEGETDVDGEYNSRRPGTTRSRRSGQPIAINNRVANHDRQTRAYRGTKEYREAFRHWCSTGEYREELLGVNTQGGYLVTPTQLSDDIVKIIDNFVFVRQFAKIQKVQYAQSLGVPQITQRMSAANWTTEVAEVEDDTSLTFGRRDLTPNILSKLAKVSIRLLQASVDVEPVISEELSYQFAVTEENAYLNGSGSGQPLGVFVASANGIPSSTDYTTLNSGTLVADDLIGAKFGIKQPYLASKGAAWIMHRTIVKLVRTLKDSYGQYLYQPGLQMSGMTPSSGMILDIPLCISEYAPNTYTSGDYVGILGNFSYYRIAEVEDLVLQRLVERYADTNEIGFIGRKWLDGAPALGEAFSRIKIQ